MNKINLLIGATIILLASAFAAYKAGSWKVKDDYTVSVFEGGAKFATFKGLKASILFDEESLEKSKISASIEANSVDCDNNKSMVEGAKAPDALDAAKFPLISFDSKAIVKKDKGYEATGNLTLKGVTKEIKLPFTFEKEIFKGGFEIDPKDFNITNGMFQKNLRIVLTVPVAEN